MHFQVLIQRYICIFLAGILFSNCVPKLPLYVPDLPAKIRFRHRLLLALPKSRNHAYSSICITVHSSGNFESFALSSPEFSALCAAHFATSWITTVIPNGSNTWHPHTGQVFGCRATNRVIASSSTGIPHFLLRLASVYSAKFIVPPRITRRASGTGKKPLAPSLNVMCLRFGVAQATASSGLPK